MDTWTDIRVSELKELYTQIAVLKAVLEVIKDRHPELIAEIYELRNELELKNGLVKP